MRCRVNGCESSHGDDQVCCKRHWFKLPKAMRDEIWRLYRSAPNSREHVEAVYAALGSL